MSERTKLGLAITAAAGFLGVAADALLRTDRVGLNGFLWVAVLFAAVLALARRLGMTLTGEGRWLIPPAILLAAAFMWRDSPTLVMLDTLALAAVMALMAATAREGSLRAAGILECAAGGFLAAVQTAFGALTVLLNDIQWDQLPRSRWSAHTAAAARGLLIALPLLLVFGALFAAADAVFEKLLVDLFDWNLPDLFSHLLLTGFWAWIVAGFLRATLAGWKPDLSRWERPAALTVGMLETGIVLGTLNALFLAFVLVQFRYFFGGAALVEATTGLTYAEYARRGFFELVAVAGLMLPTLLLGHWLQPAGNPAQQRVFRALAGALVAMLLVIMVSAAQRMWLYQQAFGLTESRLYATAFMAWLALLVGWFCLTVLRGRRERFAFGALVGGLAVLAALHALNPDGFIVRTNLDRAQAGHALDGVYVMSLSADAVPALIAGLPAMNEKERRMAADQILRRWTPPARTDWREWNWSRARARRMVSEHRDSLRAVAE